MRVEWGEERLVDGEGVVDDVEVFDEGIVTDPLVNLWRRSAAVYVKPVLQGTSFSGRTVLVAPQKLLNFLR